ncbi:phosphatidylinositol 4-kinase A [Marchantia polymorpha subsp. ruderalis]|uniref:1-phosphatidylinositol 4-kinase n=2 Tax=Marchantia polymorpha TaxID=3197 RepID=A0A176VDU4_MARPO|nr:hypothetical protein AXG93_461s1110 [Marchantia polymorpha subsp. ruderalis]PTQ50200.1 hypothetical protein MARPO_0001s0228 [Marchantia polymorpha]BBM99121.1 hypothetical protein Mp_1g18900 [Marchantia polymorpha subsp. ruderalis]|eukprot:PTQ50200.1 hypothetical protein MARPO_0001s0228 [Marchantia polymorpha]
MGALRELSSLLAENAELLTNNLAVLASLCPPPLLLKQSSERITARHLNGILAIAQFLAKSNGGQHREQLFDMVLEFLRSVPKRSKSSFWPSTFSTEAACSYFPELLSYVVKVADADSKVSQDVSSVIAGVIQQISAGGDVESGLSSYPGAKALVSALGQICPHLHGPDSEQIILCLLDLWIQSPQSGALVLSSSEASGTGSPLRGYHQASYSNGFKTPRKSSDYDGLDQGDSKGLSSSSENRNHVTFFSPNSTASTTPIFTPISTPLKLSGEQTPVAKSGPISGPIDEEQVFDQLPVPPTQGAFDGTPGFKRHQAGLLLESTATLEKQEIAYRILARILERAESGSPVKILHIQQLRTNSIKQLKSLLPLLKVRKREWAADVPELKTKVNVMFQASQAASILQIKCISMLEKDGKLLKAALRESLPLLMDAADGCISSPWRRSKGCEELFDSLITGVAHVASLHRSQMQRILLRFKVLVLTACAQANTWGTSLGSSFESIIKGSCTLIEVGWKSDRAAVESFVLSLAAQIREKEKGDKASQGAAMMQLNVISFLADLSISLNKPEVVELILPIFVESLEEGDAATPSLLRLKLLEAVGRMACLGCEKSYREVVVLLTRSYLDKLSTVGSSHSRTIPPEGTTERLETLPAAFLQIARGLRQPTLRLDYRQRLLALCSDVGLVAEAKNGRSGADLLGPLLCSVAEMSVDFDPTKDVDPSLLKLYRNLWFYIALFALAPPLQKGPLSTKSGAILNHMSFGQSQAMVAGISMGFSTGSLPMHAVAGPYAWNPQWSAAAELITQGTPPLVVSSVKWLEDELELNSLHNPGSSRGGNNEKAASAQRAALSAALGGRVETSSMSTISGVKATYLLAVAFLEVLRFKCCGGVMRFGSSEGEYTSALSFAFKYLETPNLTPAVHQCLVAIVQQAFIAAMSWLSEKASAIGKEGEEREAVIVAHACFLIKMTSHREDYIRDLADTLLNQLKNTFSQVLWNPRCLNELLVLVTGTTSSSSSEFGSGASKQVTHQKVRDWIAQALHLVPCTMQGLLQEQLRKLNTWQSATSEVLSLLSDIRLDVTKTDSHTGMACIPAVTTAAAAAAGVNPKLAQTGSVEVLSAGIISASIKSNYSGEIAGMKSWYVGMGGLARKDELPGRADHVQDLALNEMLTTKFVQRLQQFVVAAQKGMHVDAAAFREACLRGAALLLSDLGTGKEYAEGFSDLLRLLCWCPAHIFTPEAMETGVFVWTWVLSAAPQLGSRVLGELVDAWMWTVDTKKGLFLSGIENSGPAAKLRPELTPGEPGPPPHPDPVPGINAHRVWLGFLLDRFEVIRHGCSDQFLLIGRLLQGSVTRPRQFTTHPAAAGAFFTLMFFSLKYCTFQTQLGSLVEKSGALLLEDAVYRAGLSWFSVEPGWYDSNVEGVAQAEAISVARFLQLLTSAERSDTTPQEEVTVSCAVRKRSQDFGLASANGVAQMKAQLEAAQFLRVKVDGDTAMKERRRQLLLMLCQYEADRLDTWAYPLKESLPRWRVSGERWAEYVRVAWSVDPRIALALVARFPGVGILRTEVSSMVQGHVSELFCIPEALPYIVTPKAVEENSTVLQKLSHWAPCSITSALEFLTPAYKGHPRVMAYVLRVLETYPPERVTFFMPQLVQSLRYDQGGLVEGYLLVAAQRSNLFAHILIWQLQGEEAPTSEEANKEPGAAKGNMYEIVPRVKQRIIDGFTPEAYNVFLREFRFFDKITSISGALYPLPKDERRAGIRRELEKIEVEGDDLYLPTDPKMLVRGIRMDSGIPLQSAAKVPIMITFDVVEKDGDHRDIKGQACIFKVGDDCRQDVLALQVIALMKGIFEAVGLNLYLFPYGVLPTGYGRGIIEVVPDTRSRNQMGEITDGGLYDVFKNDYGPVGSARFEKARDNFIVSSAGYAVASLLLQPKDRHNGNLLFDSEGRLVHIDFGFILETSPGGNMRFESAQFKLSHEMTQLLDPSGSMKSDTWHRFVSLCVKGYLVAREHMDGIINTVQLMVDSGLPCFSRGDPIGNLRKRFHPEMSEREAANFMIKTCKDAYNKWTTAGYDLIQHLQQGIEM